MVLTLPGNKHIILWYFDVVQAADTMRVRPVVFRSRQGTPLPQRRIKTILQADAVQRATVLTTGE
jgi:hypothetical protein